LSQARSCLPNLSVAHKHGVTTPDEVLNYLIEGKAATKLTKAPSTAFGSPKDSALRNILFTVLVCEEAEVVDAILQLNYLLNTMKLACLINKLVSFFLIHT